MSNNPSKGVVFFGKTIIFLSGAVFCILLLLIKAHRVAEGGVYFACPGNFLILLLLILVGFNFTSGKKMLRLNPAARKFLLVSIPVFCFLFFFIALAGDIFLSHVPVVQRMKMSSGVIPPIKAFLSKQEIIEVELRGFWDFGYQSTIIAFILSGILSLPIVIFLTRSKVKEQFKE